MTIIFKIRTATSLKCGVLSNLTSKFSAVRTLQTSARDYWPQKNKDINYDEIYHDREKYMSPMMLFYKKPLAITDGYMQYLYDESGKRYLDFFAGILTCSVGHCHPNVVRAIQEQSNRILMTTSIYMNPSSVYYAKKLCEKLPENYKVFCVNSGSEANELAIYIARLYTGSYDIVALRNAYHGWSSNTIGMCGLSTWKFRIPQGFGIHHAKFPDLYRGNCPSQLSAADFYSQDVEEVINSCTPGQLAAFISEPIQGAGGFITMPDLYLQKVYATVRKYGGLCIADEVQTGSGRTGTFWGYQQHGVIPDIITSAKGIGNGFPFGIVAAKKEIFDTLKSKLFVNTFSSGPIASAVGSAVLKTIDDDNLQQNASNLGLQLKEKLLELKEKYEEIGDVRGQGLMLAVEFVKNKQTKEPFPQLVVDLMEALKDKNILVGKGGFHGNCFRISPPLCIDKIDVDHFISALKQCLDDTVGTSAL